MSADAPPSFDPVNTIELVSTQASKITNVSLYSGRAEITRAYKFTIKTGQNQVKISSLPDVMDQDTLRVEGRGAATIHGVTIARTPVPPVTLVSPTLTEFNLKKERVEKALDRCKKSIASLDTYLSTLSVERVGASEIASVIGKYDEEGEKLDNRLLELEGQLKQVEKNIKAERDKLAGVGRKDDRLGYTATIGVFADHEGEVEIVLIYAVRSAAWSAAYDIRVNIQSKETPVSLIYKAIISQTTGEAWEDIPLTLETVTPTFGVGLPHLSPWRLSIYQPPQSQPKLVPANIPGGLAVMRRSGTSRRVTSEELEADDDEEPVVRYRGAPPPPMVRQVVEIEAKGNLSTTFRVPGLTSIPSDHQSHQVTIVQLQLDASMSWISIPRVDTRVHLKAKIKNDSEYSLLPGSASVYVDGSFISKSNVPAVSPQESFDCPLGLDPSIRMTYHPLVKKASQSGFYNKTCTRSFAQRLTIHNTKTTPVGNFKIIDHVPISEDSQINVKLISPALILPPSGANKSSGGDNTTVAADTASTNTAVGGGGRGTSGKLLSPVQVQAGIHAQWEGADEPDADISALGKDGKFCWVCMVPAQGKVNLAMQWEVSFPVTANVVGL